MTSPTLPDLMSSGDAAIVLGVPRAVVMRPIKAGILPGQVHGQAARTSYLAVIRLKQQWQEEATSRDEDSYT